MKKAIVALLISMLMIAPVNAMVWLHPSGVWVSDTCVTPTGQWFTFINTFGPVGANCWFNINGVTFYGKFS
jgi:hypothetical protein